MKKWLVAMYAILGMERDERFFAEIGCEELAKALKAVKLALFDDVEWGRDDEADEDFISVLAPYALDGAREVLMESKKNGLDEGLTRPFVMRVEDDIRFLIPFLASH